MRKFKIIPLLLLLLTMATSAAAQKKTQKTYIFYKYKFPSHLRL